MNIKAIVHTYISVSIMLRYLNTKAALSAGLYVGQSNMLQFIRSHDGCTQKELAKATYISAPSAATSLKRMEKTGLVKRITDLNDPRKNHISITVKGKKTLDEFERQCEEIAAKLFKDFSNEELEQLHGLLLRLYDNLDAGNADKVDIRNTLCSKRGETKDA